MTFKQFNDLLIDQFAKKQTEQLESKSLDELQAMLKG